MIKLTSVLLTTSVLMSGMANASITTFEKNDNSISTEICVAAVEGNVNQIRKFIKSPGLNKNLITKKLKCNGDSLHNFLIKHGQQSNKVAKYLSMVKS